MMSRLWLLVSVLSLSGCNCFQPVDECIGIRCYNRDGGRKDGGLDAGHDGGSVDAGPQVCALWDGGSGVGKCAAITGYVAQGTQCHGECVLYPISSPGIFPSLGACVSCGCDTKKFTTGGAATPVTGPGDFCDELAVFTPNPGLLAEAFDRTADGGFGYDGGTCIALGAVNWRCPLWRGSLGDAGFARACATTLIPGVTEVQCVVYIH